MLAWESDDCPPDLAGSFWQYVLDFERAPLTTNFEQLLAAGIELPPAEAMSDADLTAKLWEVIAALARLRVFLSSTNHLSDRELYEDLWSDLLREAVPDLPRDANTSCHLDILGACSEEDMYLRFKYYASEEERRDWLADFPEDEMPAHEDPPFDRDRLLPRARD
jgi:hypothetical protein